MSEDLKLKISSRKDEHIDLAKQSVTLSSGKDSRFVYEPLLSPHPNNSVIETKFLNKNINAPIWISSMTGGSINANKVNKQLAEVASELGLGMGLGSCRALLENEKFFDDFNLRPILGDSLPLLANIGIAQIEKINKSKIEQSKLLAMLEKLRVDGLIIHINPLQEFTQPEGDFLTEAPIKTLETFIKNVDFPVLVKEVGQGMGPESLNSLLNLDIHGIELAAYGGTNFTKLELLRSESRHDLDPLSYVGHDADEMIMMINNNNRLKDKEFIISGGVTNFLDAHYLKEQFKGHSIVGMAGTVLHQLSFGQERLVKFLNAQIKGLSFAKSFLRVRKNCETK